MAETIATLVARLTADPSGFKAGLDSAQRDLTSFSTRAKSTSNDARTSFRGIAAGWTQMAGTLAAVGVGIGFAQLINDAAAFERQMIVIRATSGATALEMAELERTVRRTGLEFRVGARAAAQATYELQKSGISLTDINAGALDSAVTLAQALGGNFADSASVAATAMQVFREDASRLDEVIQGVTGTVLGGRFELADYTVALQQGGGAARNAGLGLEDFNAALLLIQRNIGSSGSDTGTALRTFLSRLTPQSQEAADAMRRLNLVFYDTQGRFIGLQAAAERIRVAFSGLTDEARNRNFNQIFGVDAMRVAVALYNEGGAGVSRFRSEVQGAANAAEIAQARTEGFAGATAGLRAAFEELGVAIGQSGIMDVMTALTNWAAGGVSNISRAINAPVRGLPGQFVGDPLNDRLALLAYQSGLSGGPSQAPHQLPADYNNLRALNPDYREAQSAAAYLQYLQRQNGGGVPAEFMNQLLSEPIPSSITSPDGRIYGVYRDTPMGQELARILGEMGFEQPGVHSRRRYQGGVVGGTVPTEDENVGGNGGGGSFSSPDTRGEFYERLADEFADDLTAFGVDAGLLGGQATAEAFYDELIAELDQDSRRQRLNQSAADLAESWGGSFERAFVQWGHGAWDWDQLADDLGRSWNQLLWDVFIGDDVDRIMHSIALELKDMLDGLVSGLTGDQSIGTTIGRAISSIFSGGGNGGGNAGGSNWISSALSAVGSFFSLPRRHSGGPVNAGQPYIVGKTGAEELFVPDVSGHVLPGQMRGAAAPRVMQVHVTYDLTGANGDRTIEAIVQRNNAALKSDLLATAARAAPGQLRQHALLEN